MRNKTLNPELVFDLINAFKSLKSENESALFLQDILTASEIKNLSVRLRIAKLLLIGKKQRDISLSLNASIATVTKVSVWLSQKGEGFKKVIGKLPIKYTKPTKPIHGPAEFHLPEIIAQSIQYGIASSQGKNTTILIKNIKEKSKIDKQLKEVSDDIYKH